MLSELRGDQRLRSLEREARESPDDYTARYKYIRAAIQVGQTIPLEQPLPPYAEYRTVKAYAYSAGIRKLRSESEQEFLQPYTFIRRQAVTRPLTFKETLKARLDDYNSGKEDNLHLFQIWLDTCAGIGYSGQDEDKFKIVPESEDLIAIPEGFNQSFLPVQYKDLQGTELSKTQDGIKYNSPLTRQEAKVHPAWIAAVDDTKLLGDYAEVAFNELQKRGYRKGMGFYLMTRIDQDQLRALCLYDLDGCSYAYGGYGLSNGVQFARVAQQK